MKPRSTSRSAKTAQTIQYKHKSYLQQKQFALADDKRKKQKTIAQILQSGSKIQYQGELTRSSQLGSSKSSIQSRKHYYSATASTLTGNTPGRYDQLRKQPQKNARVPMTPSTRIPNQRDEMTAQKNTIVEYRDSIVLFEEQDSNLSDSSDNNWPDVQIVIYDDPKYVMFEQTDPRSKSVIGYDQSNMDLKSPSRTHNKDNLSAQNQRKDSNTTEVYCSAQVQNKSPPLQERNASHRFEQKHDKNQPNNDRFIDEELEKEFEILRPISGRSQKVYLSKENCSQIKKDLNKFCIECEDKDPQWCSINNGIFICLHCSAFHRGYGVQISFVRSLEMDQFDPIQIKMLAIGGNSKFLQFTQLFMIQNEDKDRHSKYYTKACALYREKLLKCAEDDLDFIVDQTWFDELTQTEGHEMDELNNQAHNNKIERRSESESSPNQEAQNFGGYFSGKMRNIPSFFQSMAYRDTCCTKFSSCTSKSNAHNEAQTDLRQPIPKSIMTTPSVVVIGNSYQTIRENKH